MIRRITLLLVLVMILVCSCLICAEEDDERISLEGEPVRYLAKYYEDNGWSRDIYWNLTGADGNMITEHFANNIYKSPVIGTRSKLMALGTL